MSSAIISIILVLSVALIGAVIYLVKGAKECSTIENYSDHIC
jgi:hypothetical protein